MRFTSKRESVESVDGEHRTLVELVRSIPKSRYREADVWGDGWTIRDLLAHITAWEQMFLGWYRIGRDGGHPSLRARGFKWNETPRLNQAIAKLKRRTHKYHQRQLVDGSDLFYERNSTPLHKIPPTAVGGFSLSSASNNQSQRTSFVGPARS